jgi:TPR repeat protein
MESLWKAYRNRWTLQLCAVLIEGDKPSDSVTSSHVHDAFHGGEDDYDISDGLLENEWWYLSMSHKDLLDMSLSYDCWTIGRVSRKDLFCWNWLAVLRGKIEKTCHNDNGIFHLLDFPLAMSGGSSGITRQPSTWQPHFDYWNEFPPLEPRVSLAVLLFATRHCDSSLCSVLVRPKSVVYQSPSLFLQSNGALVTQFGLVSGRGKAYVSPWSIPLNEWVYLTLSCHGLKMEVCMWFGSSSLPQCYDLNFPEPVHYDSTIPWTIGSASSLQSFQGYISQVTIYQGFYLNKKNFPRPHKTFHWLTVDELKHNCFMLTKSIGLLQQFGMATGNVSCSVDEWLPNVFTYHVLNKKESGSWSVEAAQLALAFIQSKLNLTRHKVHSLIHEANIPDSLLSKFYRNMISWLKGNAVSFEPNAYAIYAGCYDNPNALFYAGITHLIEQPDHNNKQKGITLLLAAAAQGSVLAQLALGYRHRFGIDDVPESCPMALSYYLAVARDALDIFRGEDETRSITEAIRLSEPEMVKSQNGERTDVVQYLMYEADYGNPDAQADLGLMHYWGQQGLQRDFNMAFHYYQQAARAGLPMAQYSLAIMYLKGHGTQQDNETALKYLTSAAGQGIVAALNGLGYYYLNVADPPNVTAAVNYFERAAELGNHDAAFNLGIIHYNGQTGVPNKVSDIQSIPRVFLLRLIAVLWIL